MKPSGSNEIRDILNMLSKVDKMTQIDESLIEAGIILKSFIYEDEECTVSLLMLSPGARIKEHKHVFDSETYFIFKDKKMCVCESGETHSLENPYTDWMPVLSVKYKTWWKNHLHNCRWFFFNNYKA